MSERAVLHVKGRILVGPDEVRDELWVVGEISYDRPAGARDVRTFDGWVLPGLVDAHCHVGLDRHGAVPEDVAEKQALTDRDAGALLLRDAGSPSDTRWIDDRDDLPRSSGPAGASPAPGATSGTTPGRSSPTTSSRTSPRRPGAATAG
ncbi:hypothetical protein STENM223S_05471 [Streptomyces tendae]